MEKYKFKNRQHPSELGEIGSYFKINPFYIGTANPKINSNDLLIFSFYHRDAILGWVCQFYNLAQNQKYSYVLSACNWMFVPYD